MQTSPLYPVSQKREINIITDHLLRLQLYGKKGHLPYFSWKGVCVCVCVCVVCLCVCVCVVCVCVCVCLCVCVCVCCGVCGLCVCVCVCVVWCVLCFVVCWWGGGGGGYSKVTMCHEGVQFITTEIVIRKKLVNKKHHWISHNFYIISLFHY